MLVMIMTMEAILKSEYGLEAVVGLTSIVCENTCPYKAPY